MERRDFVKTGLAGAAVGIMSASLASAQDQSHAHHAGKALVMPLRTMNSSRSPRQPTPVKEPDRCIAECNRVLATGEASMAECQEAVLSMVSVCGATAANATMHLAPEKLLRQLVEACANYCDYCADACEAHAEHYAECKNCMESCRECSKACKAYLET